MYSGVHAERAEQARMPGLRHLLLLLVFSLGCLGCKPEEYKLDLDHTGHKYEYPRELDSSAEYKGRPGRGGRAGRQRFMHAKLGAPLPVGQAEAPTYQEGRVSPSSPPITTLKPYWGVDDR
jgi:hypothetical protein